MCNEPKSLSTAGEVRVHCGAGTNGVSAAGIRHMINVRKLRAPLISANAFADPAWDILLEAFAGSLEESPCPARALSAASGVPQSTAHRWLAKLVSDGLMEPVTGERSDHYRLTQNGYLVMRNYFETAGLPI